MCGLKCCLHPYIPCWSCPRWHLLINCSIMIAQRCIAISTRAGRLKRILIKIIIYRPMRKEGYAAICWIFANFLLKNWEFSGSIKMQYIQLHEGIRQEDKIFYCNFFFWKLRNLLYPQLPWKVAVNRGLVPFGGTGRDDISMQFASQDFQPCRIYTWVAVKLPLASTLYWNNPVIVLKSHRLHNKVWCN